MSARRHAAWLGELAAPLRHRAGVVQADEDARWRAFMVQNRRDEERELLAALIQQPTGWFTRPHGGTAWTPDAPGGGIRASTSACMVSVSLWPLYRSTGRWNISLRRATDDAHTPSTQWWRKTAAEAIDLAERELRRCTGRAMKR